MHRKNIKFNMRLGDSLSRLRVSKIRSDKLRFGQVMSVTFTPDRERD